MRCLQVRDTDGGHIIPVKLMNHRLSLRFGTAPDSQVTIPMLGVELKGTSAADMQSAFTRICAAANSESVLSRAISLTDIFISWEVVDSAAPNFRRFKVNCQSMQQPSALHYRQRCDSHQLNLTTMRGFDNAGIINPTFCFAKLLRNKAASVVVSAALSRTWHWCM